MATVCRTRRIRQVYFTDRQAIYLTGDEHQYMYVIDDFGDLVRVSAVLNTIWAMSADDQF